MNIRRLAGNIAILQGLASLLVIGVYFVGYPAAGFPMSDFADTEKLAAFMMSHSALVKTGWVTDLFFGFGGIVLGLAFYRRFQKAQPQRAALQAVFSVVGGALFFGSGSIGMLVLSALENLQRSNPTAALNVLLPISTVQVCLETGGIFLVSVALWNTCRCAQLTNAYSKFAIYSGYFGAVGGLLNLPISIFNIELAAMTSISVLGVAIFSFSIGLDFLRKPAENHEIEAAFA